MLVQIRTLAMGIYTITKISLSVPGCIICARHVPRKGYGAERHFTLITDKQYSMASRIKKAKHQKRCGVLLEVGSTSAEHLTYYCSVV